MQPQTLTHKGKNHTYLGPISTFWTLSSTINTCELILTYFEHFSHFFTYFSFSFHILCNSSPTLVLLPNYEPREFTLDHASLCLKNKGKDGPNSDLQFCPSSCLHACTIHSWPKNALEYSKLLLFATLILRTYKHTKITLNTIINIV